MTNRRNGAAPRTQDVWDLDALSTRVPVKIGGNEYQLDPGEVPITLKIQIENFVNQTIERATDGSDETEDDDESARLCARALGVEQAVAKAYRPLDRWLLLRFLANGALPPRPTKP